jgi:hypothetical protein
MEAGRWGLRGEGREGYVEQEGGSTRVLSHPSFLGFATLYHILFFGGGFESSCITEDTRKTRLGVLVRRTGMKGEPS